MKVLDPRTLVAPDRLARWGYMAFAIATLLLVRRAKDKTIAREVTKPCFLRPCGFAYSLARVCVCLDRT